MPTPIPTGGEVKVLFKKLTHHPIYKNKNWITNKRPSSTLDYVQIIVWCVLTHTFVLQATG